MSIDMPNDMSIDMLHDMSIDVPHDMSIDVPHDMSIDKKRHITALSLDCNVPSNACTKCAYSIDLQHLRGGGVLELRIKSEELRVAAPKP